MNMGWFLNRTYMSVQIVCQLLKSFKGKLKKKSLNVTSNFGEQFRRISQIWKQMEERKVWSTCRISVLENSYLLKMYSAFRTVLEQKLLRCRSFKTSNPDWMWWHTPCSLYCLVIEDRRIRSSVIFLYIVSLKPAWTTMRSYKKS